MALIETMTTTEAIKETIGPVLYEAMRKHNSPPEILKIAAQAAFIMGEPPTDPAHAKIRLALIELNRNGNFLE